MDKKEKVMAENNIKMKVGRIEFAPKATDQELFEAMLQMDESAGLDMPPKNRIAGYFIKKEKYDRLVAGVERLTEESKRYKYRSEKLFTDVEGLKSQNAALRQRVDEAKQLLNQCWIYVKKYPGLCLSKKIDDFINAAETQGGSDEQ